MSLFPPSQMPSRPNPRSEPQAGGCRHCGARLAGGVCPICSIHERLDPFQWELTAHTNSGFERVLSHSGDVDGEDDGEDAGGVGESGVEESSGSNLAGLSFPALPVFASSSGAGLETDGGVARIRSLDSVLETDVKPKEETDALTSGSFLNSRPDPASRYQLGEEIARGGMGIVYQGHDLDLGRDLAVKVLLNRHRQRPESVRRFIEEARICGQLQHPGIVPVYELGALNDRRPFFAMKLVRGRTLAQLLADRPDSTADRPRFLSIFEQVAQTVAYAHSQRVIHRDLKPSNVMVGSFGEVQVMDWGLAKVLSDGLGPSAREKEKEKESESEETEKGGSAERDAQGAAEGEPDININSDSDLSRDGDVMGTPSHMAPEQARGQIDRIDERADVFALGSILCEVLTGRPAHRGKGSRQVQRKAASGDLTDAFARLDASGADAELIELAKVCMAPERDARPRDAGEVVLRFSGYLAGVQEKLRAAEQERAVAAARSVEERRRRRLKAGLAASVFALGVLAVGAAGLRVQDHRIALAKAEAILDQAEMSLRLAERLESKAGALKQREADLALKSLGAPPSRGVEARFQALRERCGKAERIHQLAEALESIRIGRIDDQYASGIDRAFRKEFLRVGLDPDRDPPEKFSTMFAGYDASVEIASALDKWTTIRRRWRSAPAPSTKELEKGDREDWRGLIAAARATDPNPWRDALRTIRSQPAAEAKDGLVQLAEDHAGLDRQPAPSLVLLAECLEDAGERSRVVAVLQRAWGRFADDFWVNYHLGALSWAESEPGRGHYLRPEEAVRHLSIAAALRPSNSAVRNELGVALVDLDRMEEAAAIFRQVIAMQPSYAAAHFNLGNTLRRLGQNREALDSFRQAIRTRPMFAPAYANLGNLLRDLGRPEEALPWNCVALKLRPDAAVAHWNVGLTLHRLQRTESAMAEYREAIRLEPNHPGPRHDLGALLFEIGKLDEAEVSLRLAISLRSSFDALSHKVLAYVLKRKGKYEDALTELRLIADHQASDPAESSRAARTIEDIERLIALLPRLDAVISGSDRPRDSEEAWRFAEVCRDHRRHAAAVKIAVQALADGSPLDDDIDRARDHRYNAVCSAILAGCGPTEDQPPPDASARAKLRAQAQVWLDQELTEWTRVLKTEPKTAQDRALAIRSLRHWRMDDDLAGVRDPQALAKLPEEERRLWSELWARADRLLSESSSPDR